MSVPGYLPAIRTKVRSLGLGCVSVRTSDGSELGKLVGFVVDPHSRHLRSLVMDVADDAGSKQVELPMVPVSFDSEAQVLRLVEAGVPVMTAFRHDSVSQVDEDDLWIPIVHSAA